MFGFWCGVGDGLLGDGGLIGGVVGLGWMSSSGGKVIVVQYLFAFITAWMMGFTIWSSARSFAA